MTKTMTGYVDLDDGELYYEMAGDGDILVLGHAGFVDSRMWDAQWDAFSRSIGSFALTCEGTGNRIQLQGQELGVMTSSNYWTTSTLNAQLCLDVHWPEQINPRVRQHAAEMNLIPVSKLC